MKAKVFSAAAILLSLPMLSRGDVIILKSGQVLNGIVLQKDEKGILIRLDYGTFTYPLSMVRQVKVEEKTNNAAYAKDAAEVPEKRIPAWGTIITQLAKRSWASELKQIPATVIDPGKLRNVPYTSFVCAYAYEMNIYGDPDNPAGLEIGIRRHLLNNNGAKSNCIEFISSILPSKTDKEIVAKLNWTKDSSAATSFTFEITPPTDEDAYGGWWISVYNEEMLGKALASEPELREITEFIPPGAVGYTAAPESASSQTATAAGSPATWSTADYAHTAPYRAGRSSGGPVYVRNYYRKDGAYVHSHTRSR